MVDLSKPIDKKSLEGFAKFWNWTQKVGLIGFVSIAFALFLIYIWVEFGLVEIFGDIGSIVAIIPIVLIFFVMLVLLLASK